ncbi:hypothetical protein LR48_Vigan10g027700 [Vigna angularis]|uniref:Uncharacterized protein n=1 Tax=Phaseolus angularis TaxID=3914 RepID=A0A0L9VH37_PHAAN|nr:hypothetical protein LR48_Vigan10g027700 [Vigna angularis]
MNVMEEAAKANGAAGAVQRGAVQQGQRSGGKAAEAVQQGRCSTGGTRPFGLEKEEGERTTLSARTTRESVRPSGLQRPSSLKFNRECFSRGPLNPTGIFWGPLWGQASIPHISHKEPVSGALKERQLNHSASSARSRPLGLAYLATRPCPLGVSASTTRPLDLVYSAIRTHPFGHTFSVGPSSASKASTKLMKGKVYCQLGRAVNGTPCSPRNFKVQVDEGKDVLSTWSCQLGRVVNGTPYRPRRFKVPVDEGKRSCQLGRAVNGLLGINRSASSASTWPPKASSSRPPRPQLGLQRPQRLGLQRPQRLGLNLSASKGHNLSASKGLNFSAFKGLKLSISKGLNFSASKGLNFSASKGLKLSISKGLKLSAIRPQPLGQSASSLAKFGLNNLAIRPPNHTLKEIPAGLTEGQRPWIFTKGNLGRSPKVGDCGSSPKEIPVGLTEGRRLIEGSVAYPAQPTKARPIFPTTHRDQ